MINVRSIWNSEVFKVIYIGICFMIFFAGFYTITNLQKVFLESTKKENPSYSGDGYTSLAIVYLVYSGSMWIVPSITNLIGTRLTFTIGSLGYRSADSLFIASFLADSGWILYAGSVCCGIGAAMVWTCEGSYLVLVSSKATITRNTAIFNIIFQSSMFYGNTFAYLTFNGKKELDKSTRVTVILFLLGMSITAAIVTIFLPTPNTRDENKPGEEFEGPIFAIKKMWEMTCSKHMLLLFGTFMYLGLQICFMSGVYGACVGFTKQIDHSEQLVPLIGLIVGVGEITAEFIIIVIGKSMTKWKWAQTSTMLFALLTKFVDFSLIYLHFPSNSVFGETYDSSILAPSWTVAIICAYLIGITDGIYMSMMPAMVGILYPNNGISAIASFNFSTSLFTAVGFFSSNYISLHSQLLVLTVTGSLGALCYIYVSIDVFNQAARSSYS